MEKSEEQPKSGYFIPDTGDGNPGIIPINVAEPVTEASEPQEAYYGKCVLTSVSNFWANANEQTGAGQAGSLEPEKVRVIHYPDCQQLVFHMPRYAWDAGTFRLTNACSQEVIEEKPVRERLNGSTMILTNTLPYPPGFYTIDANWPDGWTHRIQFIKFTEGFPTQPYDNAPANILRAIRNEEVHLLMLPVPEEAKRPTVADIKKPAPYPGYSSPPCSLQMIQNSNEHRLFDYNGVEIDSGVDLDKFKNDLIARFTPVLEYTQDGRGGSIYYKEHDIKIEFYWEFGGGNAVVIFYIPETKYWEAQTGTPLSRRDEILKFVCEQVIRDQAQGCTYKIYGNSVSILR